MADDNGNRNSATAPVKSPNRCYAHRHRKIKREGDSEDLDLISSLPDVILQQILSFIPTKLAIRTSVLSTRWRHVWYDTPSLSFDSESFSLNAGSLNKTLTRYTARKMLSFHLYTYKVSSLPYIDEWLEFVMSRNVENLSLKFDYHGGNNTCKFPDLFYVNSVLKQLSVQLFLATMLPTCSVSWTSLKNLSLRLCTLSDESIANILSGCPILESLTLSYCKKLTVLDLKKLPRLRILDICLPELRQIVAPHIHCLILKHSQLPCTLVDISSLTEAKLEICFCGFQELNADVLQVIVLKMLEKLKNVEKLAFEENFLTILSLAELRGVPFPTFRAETLTLETVFSQYAIPGIVRVLQNSPKLKRLTLIQKIGVFIPKEYLENYLVSYGLNLDRSGIFGYTFGRNIVVDSKHVVLFMILVLKTTNHDLEKMVVRLEGCCLNGRGFEELLKIVPMLSHDNNVSIMLN